MCVPAVPLLFDRCGCSLYNLLTSSSACSAKSYGVFHIQGPYSELDSPLVFRIISNACWGSVGTGRGSVGTGMSFVSLTLFVLFILQFRWRVSYYPTCVLMQCS